MADCELAEVTARCNFRGWTALVHSPGLTWQGMKLKKIIPQRYRSQIVRQFGNAKLIRQPNGQHKLVGGTDADRAAAFEWSSLFAHEILFTHFRREDHVRSRRASRGLRHGSSPRCEQLGMDSGGRTPLADDEAHALGLDSIMGERRKRRQRANQ